MNLKVLPSKFVSINRMAELIEVKSELIENNLTRYEITSWKAIAKDMSDWKWATLETSSPTIIIIIMLA
jgi:hypothetical protein